MALFRLILAICLCATGLTAQNIFSDLLSLLAVVSGIPQLIYHELLYGNAIDCPKNDSMDLDVSKMKYILYDFENNINKTYENNELANDTTIDKSREFDFYFLGFAEKPDSENCKKVIKNFRCRNASLFYLIIVDYSYYTAVTNLVDVLTFFQKAGLAISYGPSLGKRVAILLEALVKSEVPLPIENIVLVGYSLGGQIAGVVGRVFFGLYGQKLLLIIGCDPAGPCYDKGNMTYSLNKDSAVLVIIVNCDQGNLGTKFDYGHVTFKSEGGNNQRGCSIGSTPTPLQPLLTNLQAPTSSICSHLACPYICTLPFCDDVRWQGKLCNSLANYASGACNGNSSCRFSGLAANCSSGIYYFTTANTDIGTPLP